MAGTQIIRQCFAVCVISLVAMKSAFADISLLHPMGGGGQMGGGGLFLQADIDTPDATFISSSPLGMGGHIMHSVDLGDAFFSLGGLGGLGGLTSGYAQRPMVNQAMSPRMSMVPSYRSYPTRRRSSYQRPSRRYGRSRRMRLVPV